MPKSKPSPPTDQPNPDPALTDLQSQLQVSQDNWKRALADYQNLLRRVESEKREYIRLSNANLIARLIPSLDILDLAAAHTHDLGVEMAAKQFRQSLLDEGVAEITPAVGEVFDPHIAECSDTLPGPTPDSDNTVAELVLKGYRLGDYILRPAKVKVFQSNSSANSSST